MLRFRRTRRRLRAIAVLAVAGLAVAGLAACGGGSSGAGGSATSGTVNWWGWSPTAQAAKADIAAFNKVYPHITVNFKLLPVVGVAAQLRPALASGSDGPDVYDVTPGPEMKEFGRFATDLRPAVRKALGPDWKSKVAAGGINTLSNPGGSLAALSVGSVFGGTLWINKNLFDQYHLAPPTTLSQWVSDCKTFKAHNVGCFVQGVASLGFSQDTL